VSAAIPGPVAAAGPGDSGFASLALIARFHGVAADPAVLRRQFAPVGDGGRVELLRAAQAVGLKARDVRCDWASLPRRALPAIAAVAHGRYVVLAAANEDRALVQDPGLPAPQEWTAEEWRERATGELILLTKRATLADVAQRFDFSWFLPALYKYRRLFSEVLVASFFVQLLALVTPLFFQVVIDKVLVHGGLTTLDVLAIGLVLVSLFEVVLSGLRTYVLAHTTTRVDVELGTRLYRHLLGLPISFYVSRQVGTIVARVRELDTIREFLTGSTLTVVIDLFFTLVFFAVMFWYSVPLTLIVLAAVPIYVLLSVLVTPVLRRRLDERFMRAAQNQAFLTESIAGAETVKANSLEPQMQRRWEEQLAGYVAASFRVVTLGNTAQQIASFVSKVTTVAILWFGARSVVRGEMTVGQLVAFNMFAAQIAAPILRLVQLWQDLQQASIAVEKLGDILNLPPEPGYNPGRTSLPQLKGRIEFDRVSFRYAPGAPEAIKEFSLAVEPGEVVGIVGRSGSGKSTLARLLQRLYVPESGRVLVDGVDIALVDPAWLRRHIGVVLQENFLFNRSVRENIAIADPGLPMEAILRSAQLAGAHEFILALPQGYDTVLQEHGSNLSGGQRQRIAIARALVTNPRILVFDEATSALDYESERIIQENMRSICHGRTVFIIAHRLTAVRDANRILVLEGGSLVEQGSHRDLLGRNGRYAQLYGHQVA
jgi:subfamily B ATP-binding cassette protein HlyB/CyaB